MRGQYIPECLRNLPAQKSRSADAKRRKHDREVAELALLEGIQRVRAAMRSKPADWARGYNSAITALELFLSEVKAKQWVGTEGAVVNQKIATGLAKACTCGPNEGCTDCPQAQHPRQSYPE